MESCGCCSTCSDNAHRNMAGEINWKLNLYTFSSELDIKNLDSSDADDGMSFNAMHACIDGLMGLDAEGKIVPAIAEKHEVSKDGLTHTFTLRDAKWSNGDAVKAQDFVYAWQRIIKVIGRISIYVR